MVRFGILKTDFTFVKVCSEDRNILHFPQRTPQKCGVFISQNIPLLLTFPLPRVKRKKLIKIQKKIIAVQKLGVTEEGNSMSDENKRRPDCQV